MNYKEVEISLYVYINIHSYTMNKTIVYMQCIYRRGPGSHKPHIDMSRQKLCTHPMEWTGSCRHTAEYTGRMDGQIISTQTRVCEDSTPVLSMLFFTHYNDPHQQLGSSSYIINVAVPYSTHKCFAFVPACRAESIIYSISLTLLLQPK